MKEQIIIFEKVTDFLSVLNEIKSMRGLLVQGSSPVQLFQPLNIKIKFSQWDEFSIIGDVVNILGEKNFAVQFKNVDIEFIENLIKKVEKKAVEEKKDESLENEWVKKAEEEKEVPIYLAIKDMPVSLKKRLALVGNLSERRLLVRDRMEGVHIFVFKNPKITEEEVVEYTSLSTLSSEALTYISTNKEFMKLSQIVFNVVKNPKTPSYIALKLLPKLSINDIRYLAKGEKVKSIVAHAARKRLAEKLEELKVKV